ncbi:MAG TPA: anion transporter [Methanothrix sp.]|nr:anion transporter [Methanothrix sp.]
MIFELNISTATLVAVLILIAIRQVGGLRLHIWQIMLGGALIVLLTGQISPYDALKAINLDVMVFLAGMFIIGEAMQESGYLLRLSHRLFHGANDLDRLLLLILFGMGSLSALLMNDTLAIVGTPLMLYFARVHRISPKLLLLALAFGVTTGSVMSPIGNPQNLLIAINGGLKDPFVVFLSYLFLPTIVNLFLAYIVLRLFFKGEFQHEPLNHLQEPIKDRKLALLSEISFCMLIVLVAAKIAFVLFGIGAEFRLTYIALLSALPIMILSNRRLEISRKIDWHTLIFFAAMFVLMESVWQSGIFQALVAGAGLNVSSVPVILSLSVLMSQFISNVPFVALYQPLLAGASVKELMALAAGSTIAGNLFILGAASNVIIIQNAERNGETLTFLDFARVGIPLTLLNVLIYWLFLSIL